VVANCPVPTKVDADLVPSAEPSMAQAPSRFARERGGVMSSTPEAGV
jgi:hypothetical protein